MPNVKQPTDAPLPDCPICTTPAIHWGHHERNGVTEANYLCGNEHGWIIKWVTP